MYFSDKMLQFTKKNIDLSKFVQLKTTQPIRFHNSINVLFKHKEENDIFYY